MKSILCLLFFISLFLGNFHVVSFGGLDWKPWMIFSPFLSLLLLSSRRSFIGFYCLLLSFFFLLLFFLFPVLNPFNPLVLKQSMLAVIFTLIFLAFSSAPDTSIYYNFRLASYCGILITILASIYFLLFNPDALQSFYSNYTADSFLPRLRGLSAEANEYSQLLSIPFSYLFVHLCTRERGKSFLPILFLFLLILVQILTFSRGGVLAFLLVVGFNIFLLSKANFSVFSRLFSFRWYFLPFLIFAGSLLFLPNSGLIASLFLERISSLFLPGDPTSVLRISYTSQLFSGFINSSIYQFLFGHGVGSISDFYGIPISTSSNYLVDCLFEVGLIPTLIFISFLLYPIASSVYSIQRFTRHSLANRRHNDSSNFRSSSFLFIVIPTVSVYFSFLVCGFTYATHMLPVFWPVLAMVYRVPFLLSMASPLLASTD